jgi:hypothetical protein
MVSNAELERSPKHPPAHKGILARDRPSDADAPARAGA